MLPAILNLTKAKTHLIATVTAFAVLTAGTMPAQAWGQKEQQFLAGAVTAGLIGALIVNTPRYGYVNPVYQTQPLYQPQPVYRAQPLYQPHPVYRAHPVYQPQYRRLPQRYAPLPRYQDPVYYQPAPVSIYGTPAGRAFNTYTSNERRRIQSTLTAYGYYQGGIDGAFGPRTYDAIDAYARNTGKTASLATRAGAYGLLDGLLF
ncbi:MAG: peptidoglycan-binding protein [Alphaproteobacteria bacterium]